MPAAENGFATMTDSQNGNKAPAAMVQPRLKIQKAAMPESASSSFLSNRKRQKIKNLKTPPEPAVLGVAFSRSAWHGLLP
jgi:hypothetical protein